jgi:hypothetical protein
MGSSIWKVARVIGRMFRGSIVGHGIRSMDATTREEKAAGLSSRAKGVVAGGEEVRVGDQSAVGKKWKWTEGDRWKGLLEKEASPGQANGKGGWRMSRGSSVSAR